MGRSLRKGPYVEPRLQRRVELMNQKGEKKIVKTWSRRSMVLPEFVGHNIQVYNGKQFITVFIQENMVGHRLGEFSPTRMFRKHGAATEKVIAK